MYFDADLHLESERLLLNYEDTDKQGVLLIDLANDESKYINNNYAQGVRWSPDGLKFAYFGNGCLYIHNLLDTHPFKIIELSQHHSGFCEWSPNNDFLIFSAYGLPINKSKPPNIFSYNLVTTAIIQITNNRDVDRFPKWNNADTQIAFERTYIGNEENTTGIVTANMNSYEENNLPRAEGFSQKISRYCWSLDNQHIILTEYKEGIVHLTIYHVLTHKIVWSIKNTKIRGGFFDPNTGQIVSITETSIDVYDTMKDEIIYQLDLSDITSIKLKLSNPVVIPSLKNEKIYFLGTDSQFYCWNIKHGCEIVNAVPTMLSKEKQEKNYYRRDYIFHATDGYAIPVQQYNPIKPNGKVIIFVEGGPGAFINPDNAIVARLLEEGYEIIRPAYRGCDGYGKAHLRANENQCGKADVRDIVDCGIDYKKRFNKPDVVMAITGYSYGGYLTFLAMTHKDAPWVCGITFWGCTMIPQLVQTTGLPSQSDNFQKILDNRSPVKQAHKIKFSLLILHGSRDTTAQTEKVRLIQSQMKKAKKHCELVIFEGETHGLKGCRPEMYSHTLNFLDRNMK